MLVITAVSVNLQAVLHIRIIHVEKYILSLCNKPFFLIFLFSHSPSLAFLTLLARPFYLPFSCLPLLPPSPPPPSFLSITFILFRVLLKLSTESQKLHHLPLLRHAHLLGAEQVGTRAWHRFHLALPWRQQTFHRLELKVACHVRLHQDINHSSSTKEHLQQKGRSRAEEVDE